MDLFYSELKKKLLSFSFVFHFILLTMDTCFWALLSVNELEFIHASCLFTKKLKGVSLFDLIHPNEVSLAKRDLYKFMNSNLLGGSVTR